MIGLYSISWQSGFDEIDERNVTLLIIRGIV